MECLGVGRSRFASPKLASHIDHQMRRRAFSSALCSSIRFLRTAPTAISSCPSSVGSAVVKFGRFAPCLMTCGARVVPAHYFVIRRKNSDASFLACAAVVVFQFVCFAR